MLEGSPGSSYPPLPPGQATTSPASQPCTTNQDWSLWQRPVYFLTLFLISSPFYIVCVKYMMCICDTHKLLNVTTTIMMMIKLTGFKDAL